MSLTTKSPRFSLRTAPFDEIERAIADVGHVVLDDAWNPAFLDRLLAAAKGRVTAEAATLFDLFDARDDGKACDREFYSEFRRAGFPALLEFLFDGDFVLQRNERVIRFVDPQQPVKFTGLHNDHQLENCFNAGIKSKRGVTIWTPLQPCTDDRISRLLLLHRGDDYHDAPPQIYLHKDETKTYGPDRSGLESADLDAMFRRVYESKTCYAPYIPLGSSIIFDSDTVHASYRTAGMTERRYSIDCRAVGEYKVDASNGHFNGVIFRAADFPGPSVRGALRNSIVAEAWRFKSAIAGRAMQALSGDADAWRRILRRVGIG